MIKDIGITKDKRFFVELHEFNKGWSVSLCEVKTKRMKGSKWFFDNESALKVFNQVLTYVRPVYRRLEWYSSHYAKVTRYDMTAVRVPCITGSSKIIIHHEGYNHA